MPLITVAVPHHSALGRLLQNVADAVAGALQLAAGDVIATHVATGLVARSGGEGAESGALWPIVTILGSDRGSDRMESARDAAAHAVHEWCTAFEVEIEGVWTQWQLPMPQ